MSNSSLPQEDLEKLKDLAERTIDSHWMCSGDKFKNDIEFAEAATPSIVLALIREIERLRDTAPAKDCASAIRVMPARLRHLQKQLKDFEDALKGVYFYEAADKSDDLKAFEREIKLLNREANWLADKLKGQCEEGRYCPADINKWIPCPSPKDACYLSREDWRKAARKSCGGADD